MRVFGAVRRRGDAPVTVDLIGLGAVIVLDRVTRTPYARIPAEARANTFHDGYASKKAQ